MSQRSVRRLKTPSCQSQSIKSEHGTALDELQNEIERELQNSEKVLTAASSCRGSPPRSPPSRRSNECHVKVETSNFCESEEPEQQLSQCAGPSRSPSSRRSNECHIKVETSNFCASQESERQLSQCAGPSRSSSGRRSNEFHVKVERPNFSGSQEPVRPLSQCAGPSRSPSSRRSNDCHVKMKPSGSCRGEESFVRLDACAGGSRNSPTRSNEFHAKAEPKSPRGDEDNFVRLSSNPGASNKSSLKASAGSPNRSAHSSSKHMHEVHMTDMQKSPQDGSYDHHHHHHHHHDHFHESRDELPRWDENSVKSIGHLSQLQKSSSYITCDVDKGFDFLTVCCPQREYKRVGKPVRLPEMPCLPKEQIEEMIRCETHDVQTVEHLASENRRTYKKPCPKQEKAQMGVRAIVEASRKAMQTCGKKYSPLELPEPEDITPETAAAMMFSEEQGVKMVECPNKTINRLFEEEARPFFPDRGSVSVVEQNQDQTEMIEKSASVPSEGVSDSAYTRRMKEKGEDLGPQRSYDIEYAINQSKREHVFVTEKPQRINKVQFRGGKAPNWFPWFLSSFPDDEDGLKLVPSPSGVFYKAWFFSNPENIPTSDIIVLD